jgi:hypothetical protein
MANDVKKQVNLIAKESLRILENTLTMTKKVHVDYEKEFDKNINGYKTGDTITIKRPADFEVTDGAALSKQDVVEGSTSITIDQQKHIGVEFTAKELTLDINESGIRERVLKPAMIQLANKVDMDIMGLYSSVPNWSGTPGQVIDSFQDFGKGPERMDELAIPQDARCSVLSPADHWGLLGSQTSLYMGDVAKSAYRMAKLGDLGGVETYMSQNVPTHTVGVATGTPLVNGGSQAVAYTAVKDSMSQSLVTDGWTNSTTGILKAGDVITIANVYAVNPVTKAKLPFLRQFAVTADADSGASTGPATLTITPAIITSGSQQTCFVGSGSSSAAHPADNSAITVMGSSNTGYRQNMAFHKNAFAFVSAPLAIPPAVNNGSRQSFKGINLRLIPYYNQDTDKAGWRYDILYGVKAIDPRLAIRMSGTS